MHYYSSASFFGPFLVAIFGVHLLEGKVAILILKSIVIQGKQLAEHLTLYLFHKVVDSVAVDECSFFGIMSMQVKVKRKSVILNEVICEFLYRVHCRLLLHIWIDVVSVQVFAEAVHSKMAVVYAIDVDHWDYHEDEHLL